jgi:hypothetical protein
LNRKPDLFDAAIEHHGLAWNSSEPSEAPGDVGPPGYRQSLAQTLDATADFIARYVVLSPEQLIAAAIWVAHSHAFSAADVTPYLAIVSPESGAEKRGC